MPKMTREEEEAFVRQAEADLDDPDAWGEPVQGAPPKQRLGSVISIRLDPDLHEALSREADRRGIGYTTLARELIAAALAPTTRRVTVELEVRDDGSVAEVRATRAA